MFHGSDKILAEQSRTVFHCTDFCGILNGKGSSCKMELAWLDAAIGKNLHAVGPWYREGMGDYAGRGGDSGVRLWMSSSLTIMVIDIRLVNGK